MIALAKYSSSVIEFGKRILKSVGIGGSVMETKQCYPFGIDSQPLPNTTALWTNTTTMDESVIFGYINDNQEAGIGETRLYSLGSRGDLAGYIYLKNSGTCEIMGSEFSAVKFEPLKTAITNQDANITTELNKIALAIGSLGGSYINTYTSANVDPSKSNFVKLK